MPDKFGDKIRLQHTLEALETIEDYVKSADFVTFSENLMMQDACIRHFRSLESRAGIYLLNYERSTLRFPGVRLLAYGLLSFISILELILELYGMSYKTTYPSLSFR